MEVPLASLTPCPGHPPQSAQNHPPQAQGVSGFADASGPLFSMYLQLAGEEDKKMTENRKGDADGILIFVSPFFMWRLYAHSPQDRRPVCSPPPSQRWSQYPPRTSSQVPRTSQTSTPQASFKSSLIRMAPKFLSPPNASQSIRHIFSTKICHMGQLTLVSQLAHQPHMRTFGDIPAAMGASVHEVHSDTIRPTQMSTDSRVLCRGR
jgi:hypothetical protein